MAHGRLLAANLHRARLSETDLRERLRHAGVKSRDTVRAVVLERNGSLSILHGGDPEPWMLEDVPAWSSSPVAGDPSRSRPENRSRPDGKDVE